jgi:predicted GIY-YIG superfamily endonuclease
MASVYILRGSNGRHYIGSTVNIDRRLHEHRSGGTHTTQRLGATIDLVIVRHLPTLDAARKLERDLKKKKNPQLAIYLLQQMPDSGG